MFSRPRISVPAISLPIHSVCSPFLKQTSHNANSSISVTKFHHLRASNTNYHHINISPVRSFSSNIQLTNTMSQTNWNLKTVVAKLQEIVPLKLAEKWDNVGMLVAYEKDLTMRTETSQPREIKRILLTNDLTNRVLDEAIAKQVDLVIAYHPTIFSDLKRLNTTDPIGNVVIRCLENKIAVWSPHTAFDSMSGGVNDWLASMFSASKVTAIEPHPSTLPSSNTNNIYETVKICLFVPQTHVDVMRQKLATVQGVGVIENYSFCSFSTEGTGTFMGNDLANPVIGKKNELTRVSEVKLEMICPRSKLPDVARVIHQHHPYETPAWDIIPTIPPPAVEESNNTPNGITSEKEAPVVGLGRVVTLSEPLKLSAVVDKVKKHLGLPFVRLAIAQATPQNAIPPESILIKTIAICAGAGGTVVPKAKADLYLTGEMRHHEVLAAVQKGTSVILTDHSNTERGYLKVFKTKLESIFEKSIDVVVSTTDSDPLQVV